MANLHAAPPLPSGAYKVTCWASKGDCPLPLPTCSIYSCPFRLRQAPFPNTWGSPWPSPHPWLLQRPESPFQQKLRLPSFMLPTLRDSQQFQTPLLSTAILSPVSFVPLKSVPGRLCFWYRSILMPTWVVVSLAHSHTSLCAVPLWGAGNTFWIPLKKFISHQVEPPIGFCPGYPSCCPCAAQKVSELLQLLSHPAKCPHTLQSPWLTNEAIVLALVLTPFLNWPLLHHLRLFKGSNLPSHPPPWHSPPWSGQSHIETLPRSF